MEYAVITKFMRTEEESYLLDRSSEMSNALLIRDAYQIMFCSCHTSHFSWNNVGWPSLFLWARGLNCTYA